jgi:hypothetical protein
MSFDITLTDQTVVTELRKHSGLKRQAKINAAARTTEFKLNPVAFGVLRFNSMNKTVEIPVRSNLPISERTIDMISQDFQSQLKKQLAMPPAGVALPK